MHAQRRETNVSSILLLELTVNHSKHVNHELNFVGLWLYRPICLVFMKRKWSTNQGPSEPLNGT